MNARQVLDVPRSCNQGQEATCLTCRQVHMLRRSEGRSVVQARPPNGTESVHAQIWPVGFHDAGARLKQPSAWKETLDIWNCLSDKILRQQMASLFGVCGKVVQGPPLPRGPAKVPCPNLDRVHIEDTHYSCGRGG